MWDRGATCSSQTCRLFPLPPSHFLNMRDKFFSLLFFSTEAAASCSLVHCRWFYHGGTYLPISTVGNCPLHRPSSPPVLMENVHITVSLPGARFSPHRDSFFAAGVAAAAAAVTTATVDTFLRPFLCLHPSLLLLHFSIVTHNSFARPGLRLKAPAGGDVEKERMEFLHDLLQCIADAASYVHVPSEKKGFFCFSASFSSRWTFPSHYVVVYDRSSSDGKGRDNTGCHHNGLLLPSLSTSSSPFSRLAVTEKRCLR